jgi:hypothetical protein
MKGLLNQLIYVLLLIVFCGAESKALPYVEPKGAECFNVNGYNSFSIYYESGKRCEFAFFNSSNYCKNVEVSFDFFKRGGFDFEVIVMQFHAKRDFYLGEKFRRPPLSIKLKNDELYLDYSFDKNSISIKDKVFLDNRRRVSIAKNFSALVRLRLNVIWSVVDNGKVQLWLDDSLVYQADSISIGYNDLFMPFLKFGVYNFNMFEVDKGIYLNFSNISYKCLA